MDIIRQAQAMIVSLLISGCGQGPKEDQPMEEENTEMQATREAKFHEVKDRLPDFLDRGFVVSLHGDEKLHHGDSLFFSGLALYALDCKSGQPIADAIAKMLKDTDGGAYRHPDQASREISMDGLLTMYRGINKRIMHCGEKDFWAPLMKKTRARIAASMPAQFNLISAMMDYILGFADVPDLRRMDYLSVEVAGWAALVKYRKAAAYRIHLGLLALQTMEEMGVEISDRQRERFAAATTGTSLPTTDQFSGRGGLGSWLDSFKFDEWQYRHQREPSWERNDGDGQRHPGIDYLVGYADLYKGSPK